MSPRRQAKATHSSPGRWQRNNNSRHHSSLMPISSFPPAPPTRGLLCQPLCPGCQGQRPARCNTGSRTPSGLCRFFLPATLKTHFVFLMTHFNFKIQLMCHCFHETSPRS
uniref:Regulatory factor X7 n=1 Tax=Ovis aries TaxID=9940 RepID=A0AC11E1E7_SHEEP